MKELQTLKYNVQIKGEPLTRRQSLTLIDCLIELEDQNDRLVTLLNLNRSMLNEKRDFYSGRALECFDAVEACSDIEVPDDPNRDA